MIHSIKTLFFLLVIFTISSCKDNKPKIVEEYYPDGGVKSEITMKGNVREGLAKFYSTSGHLLSSSEYKNDKREGWVINYNPENGKVTSKAFYKNDIQDGEVILNYKEGMLFRTSTYINGRVNGVIKTYWPNGQIKAENNFKMGKPGIGLKEYDKSGRLIQQPYIIVKEINQIALLHKLILKVSLSDRNQDVDFYLDKLSDDNYFTPSTFRLRMDDGIASIEYPVSRGNTIMKKISIVARVKTNYGNTLILRTSYNLAIIN